MTEEQWLRGPDVFLMLHHIYGQATGRKLILFSCACCRRVWKHLTDARSRLLVDALEQEADRPDSVFDQHHEATFRGASDVAHLAGQSVWADFDPPFASRFASEAIVNAAWYVDEISLTRPDLSTAIHSAFLAFQGVERQSTRSHTPSDGIDGGELMVQSDLVLDIFGNPFRPVALDPSTLTSTVVSLARQMYDSRDFSPMPILADALEEAGCDNADVLDHCRGNSLHVRGCWVVDLVLGKA